MELIEFNYNDKEELLATSYLVRNGGGCFIVDPSTIDAMEYAKKHNLKIEAVLLTHSHFDHMKAVDETIKFANCPLYIGEKDIDGLTDSTKNCSASYRINKGLIVNSVPTPIYDGEILSIIDISIKVIETPYHTHGAVCYYLEKEHILFSGDSLFRYCVGRSDLPTSKPKLAKSSLLKLISLPDEVKVYPGHNKSTTIGTEKRFNRFIREL